MTKPELTAPDVRYQDSFLAAVKEYQAEDLPNYRDLNIEQLAADFPAYVEKVKNEALGIGLPEGHVPHTLLWLVDEGEYIGRVDIRHELTDYLHREGGHIGYDVRPSKRRQGYGKLGLELGIQKAKELGFSDVLVTCDVGNVGSTKIIEANGGVLEDTVPASEPGKPAKNRYWINL